MTKTLACTALAVCGLAHAGQVAVITPAQEKSNCCDSTWVAPISDGFANEDAYITTDIRVWFVQHKFDGGLELANGGRLPQGGDAQIYAIQFRYAINERLQFVAYKDGWISAENGRQNVVNQSGLADVAAGLKYAWVQDKEKCFHWASGLGYQFGIGDDEVLQDTNQIRVWNSLNKGVDKFNFGLCTNLNIPTDMNGDNGLGDLGGSVSTSFHGHVDYTLNKYVSPVVEINFYQVLDDGDKAANNSNIGDIGNIGGAASQPLVTLAAGAQLQIPDTKMALRCAYEVPLTRNNDIFEYRITSSLVYRF